MSHGFLYSKIPTYVLDNHPAMKTMISTSGVGNNMLLFKLLAELQSSHGLKLLIDHFRTNMPLLA